MTEREQESGLEPVPQSAADLDEVIDGPPPFLGTWPAVYAAVLGVLAAVVVTLYIVSRVYA